MAKSLGYCFGIVIMIYALVSSVISYGVEMTIGMVMMSGACLFLCNLLKY